MDFISFRLSGKVGHFLRAEAGASALSYPIPPRTVILGLLGAVLGISKDEPQVKLEPCFIAVSGKQPTTFWHRIKMRKEEPEYLPKMIKKKKVKGKDSGKSSMATLILQEWLFEPEYIIWVSLPEPFHQELNCRLQKRRWYFQPCMGLSEMMADLNYIGKREAVPLYKGIHQVCTVFPMSLGTPDFETLYEKKLSLNSIRMPYSITSDRVFSLRDYYMERDSSPVPVDTDKAFQWKENIIVCL